MTNSSNLMQTATSPLQQELEQTTQVVLQVALRQQQAGQLKAAEDIYRAILEIQPNQADANHHLGRLAVKAGQASAGVLHLEMALKACPEREEYWLSYIDALLQTDQFEVAQQVLDMGRKHGLQGEAVECLAERFQSPLSLATKQQITRLQFDGTDTAADTLSTATKLNAVQVKAIRSDNLTKNKISRKKKRNCEPTKTEINTLVELYRQGRVTEVETLARSLSLRFPLHGFGWKVLGAVLQAHSRFDEALLCMKEAVRLMPEDAEALCNLGASLQSQGRFIESEVSLNQALALKPDYVEALCTLGGTLLSQGRFIESEVHLNHALTLKPDYAKTHVNLGTTLLSQSRLPEATKAYKRALEIGPIFATAHSNLLFCMGHDAEVDSQQLYAAHLAFGDQFEAPQRASWRAHNNTKNSARCLRVGFVSGDLYNHAVSSFLEPVLIFLAQKQTLSLHAYYTRTIEDSATLRLRTYFSQWHAVASLNDADLAEKIRTDDIDILIDLSGHTGHNRLPTFARKPAPIQTSWMGYPGTTGLQAMDYYLTDRFLLPPGQFDTQFSEKLVYLPANAPFLPSADALPVTPLPALANGYVTFGSFNRPSKLSRTVIALWSQLLRALPDALMLLGSMPEDNDTETLISWFAQEGIDRERLSLHPRSDMSTYLALHHQVDICLDTFPYNGGTTTLHALWMGVPTLTLSGTTVAGRTGAGILGHVGLNAYVAHDAAAFVQQGLSLAADLPTLAKQRSGLRERFSQSAPGQPEVIATGLERALRTMWQRWCAGLPTESFEVNHASVQNTHNAMQEANK